MLTSNGIHRIFVASLVLKAVNAVIEAFLGVVFLFSGTVVGAILYLANHELIEDPTDFFARHIHNLAPYVSPQAQLFGAFYLLSHVAIKIFLIWGLLKNKLWAYPSYMLFLALLIVYQVVRIAEKHSILLSIFTIFDLLVLWLTWHEYKSLRVAASARG